MTVNCPRCGADNPDGAKFCSLCHSTDIAMYQYPHGQPPQPPQGEQAYGYQDPYQQYGQPGDPYAGQQYGQPGAPYPGQPPQQGSYPGQPYDQQYYGGYPPPGAPTGHPGYTGAPGHYYPQASHLQARAARLDWGKVVGRCALVALLTALASGGLEILFSFVGIGAAMGGHVTTAYIVILAVLLIPIAVATFVTGYRFESYGWVVGLITAAFWALIFRPLYYAVLALLLSGRFAFAEVFNSYVLVFVFAVWLPLGALMGWLGEKRATTGLHF